MTNYPDSPREAARAFTPELTDLINNPLYSDVWTDARLSPRDRSIATLAALTVLYRSEELPAHHHAGGLFDRLDRRGEVRLWAEFVDHDFPYSRNRLARRHEARRRQQVVDEFHRLG